MNTAIITKGLSGLMMGAVAGGMVGAIRGFMTQPGFAERLVPKPECFDMDEGAAKTFFELAKYKSIAETEYNEALHNVDSLFCLEQQLQLGEVEPHINDPATATQYAIRAMTHLRGIQSKAVDDLQHADITEKLEEIKTLLESHVQNIRLMCKNV